MTRGAADDQDPDNPRRREPREATGQEPDRNVGRLAYIAQGWVVGSEGFPATNTFATLGGYVLILAWIAWLLVVAWRMMEPATG